jgi:hypothetical protein
VRVNFIRRLHIRVCTSFVADNADSERGIYQDAEPVAPGEMVREVFMQPLNVNCNECGRRSLRRPQSKGRTFGFDRESFW